LTQNSEFSQSQKNPGITPDSRQVLRNVSPLSERCADDPALSNQDLGDYLPKSIFEKKVKIEE